MGNVKNSREGRAICLSYPDKDNSAEQIGPRACYTTAVRSAMSSRPHSDDAGDNESCENPSSSRKRCYRAYLLVQPQTSFNLQRQTKRIEKRLLSRRRTSSALTFFRAKYSFTLRWQEKKHENTELLGRGNRLNSETPSALNPLSERLDGIRLSHRTKSLDNNKRSARINCDTIDTMATVTC